MTHGACILAPAGLELAPKEFAFFRQASPWGFILFARNIDTPSQVRALTARLREAVGRNAPIFIDQEGGRVQRMRAPHWREWMPPLDETQGSNSRDALSARYTIIAAELCALGIDSNCVPCLDIAGANTHPFLKNRCLGSDPDAIVSNGKAVIEGCLRGGVLPVIKHMPGHGRATTDSHADVPRVTANRAELDATDFAVFRAFADVPVGMTGHIIFEAVDDRPATLSPTIINLIRRDIGFGGLLMTDDISMGALSGSIAQRSEAAIAAGCDLVLHCNGEMGEMEHVAEGTGTLQGPAKERAEAALRTRHQHRVAPGDIDVDALIATYEQTTKGEYARRRRI